MKNAKSLSRIYFPEAIPAHGRCALPSAQAHHVARVLRLKAGEPLILFDGRGNEYESVIASVTHAAVIVDVGDRHAVDRESPLAITLAQGLSSGERMDYTVQKAVELGVARIQPLETSRSVVRLDDARARKRCAHWQSIAISACEQCGRNRVPVVHAAIDLAGWLRSPGQGLTSPETRDTPQRLLLSLRAGTVPLREATGSADGQRPVLFLSGPEGGLSAAEEDLALHHGFAPVTLGPRVLRAETAPLAALAALTL